MLFPQLLLVVILARRTPWGWYIFTETFRSNAFAVCMYLILCIWLVQ